MAWIYYKTAIIHPWIRDDAGAVCGSLAAHETEHIKILLYGKPEVKRVKSHQRVFFFFDPLRARGLFYGDDIHIKMVTGAVQ